MQDNPYASPLVIECSTQPDHQTPAAWYTATVLAGCVSTVATLLSALLAIDFSEGNVHAQSIPAVLFMLFGFPSILVLAGIVIYRKRFLGKSPHFQWLVSIALPFGYACVMAILLLMVRRLS